MTFPPPTLQKTTAEKPGQQKTTLFLFAHQDDEIGVFHEISQILARGDRLYCVYLTNGAWDGVAPQKRNDETLKVLDLFGVPLDHIIFLGEKLGISDGRLVENLALCYQGLLALLDDKNQNIGHIDRLVMHAFEGGHQDHDAAYLVGAALAKYLDIVENSFQYPFYRMPAGRFLLSFAKPLAQNGAVTQEKIPWRARINHLSKMRHYHSQRRVMVKIGLHMAWHFLVDGHARLQAVSLARAFEAPNSGMMLYEYWHLYRQEQFRKQAAPFLKRYIGDGESDA